MTKIVSVYTPEIQIGFDALSATRRGMWNDESGVLLSSCVALQTRRGGPTPVGQFCHMGSLTFAPICPVLGDFSLRLGVNGAVLTTCF